MRYLELNTYYQSNVLSDRKPNLISLFITKKIYLLNVTFKITM